jgi:hypothetical protein
MENTDKGKMQMKTGLGALSVRAFLATLVDKKNMIYDNEVTGKYYPKQQCLNLALTAQMGHNP